jgi:hypothetical protein
MKITLEELEKLDDDAANLLASKCMGWPEWVGSGHPPAVPCFYTAENSGSVVVQESDYQYEFEPATDANHAIMLAEKVCATPTVHGSFYWTVNQLEGGKYEAYFWLNDMAVQHESTGFARALTLTALSAHQYGQSTEEEEG